MRRPAQREPDRNKDWRHHACPSRPVTSPEPRARRAGTPGPGCWNLLPAALRRRPPLAPGHHVRDSQWERRVAATPQPRHLRGGPYEFPHTLVTSATSFSKFFNLGAAGVSVKHPTPGFGSGRDLRAVGSNPCSRRSLPELLCLCPSPHLVPTSSLALSTIQSLNVLKHTSLAQLRRQHCEQQPAL